jgi:hypothetical protein
MNHRISRVRVTRNGELVLEKDLDAESPHQRRSRSTSRAKARGSDGFIRRRPSRSSSGGAPVAGARDGTLSRHRSRPRPSLRRGVTLALRSFPPRRSPCCARRSARDRHSSPVVNAFITSGESTLAPGLARSEGRPNDPVAQSEPARGP